MNVAYIRGPMKGLCHIEESAIFSPGVGSSFINDGNNTEARSEQEA